MVRPLAHFFYKQHNIYTIAIFFAYLFLYIQESKKERDFVMSAGININSFLNNFVNNQTSQLNKSKKKNTDSSGAAVNNTGVADNIFAAASALVSDYKSKTSDKKASTGSGKSMWQLANMSTEEFKQYASSNEARSSFEEKQNADSSGIKLPMIVRYKAEVFSTSGKTFMQVVAKIKAKYPQKSEEAIAAELMSKYATDEQISNVSKKYSTEQTTGNTISFSA